MASRTTSQLLPSATPWRARLIDLPRATREWLGERADEGPLGIAVATLGGMLFIALAAIVGMFILPIWMWRRGKPLGALGALVLLIIFVVAWIAPLITQILPIDFAGRNAEYATTFLSDTLEAPNGTYFLGTDANGRDILTRVLFGAEITVLVGFGTVLVTALVSTVVGVVSGYFGGLADLIIQRLVDIWIAFPPLFLLITVLAVFGSGGDGFLGIGRGPNIGPQATPGDRWIWEAFPRSTVTILTLALILSGTTSRVIRGSVLSVKSEGYVDAARGLGANNIRIMRVHILPNIMPVVIVLASINLGIAVLAEATISFLGLGIPPPFPTWGQMLSGLARIVGPSNWWVPVFPGLAIFLAVYGFNMLGDALRDVFDPRLRGSQ